MLNTEAQQETGKSSLMQNVKHSDVCEHVACVSPQVQSAAIRELPVNFNGQERSH